MAAFSAIAMGVVAVGGAVMEKRASNDNARQAANDYGVHTAQVDFAAGRSQRAIIHNMGILSETEMRDRMSLDLARQKAEADAKVSAATAGVSGQSTDVQISDIGRSEEMAKMSLNARIKAEKLQLKSNSIDTSINAYLGKGALNIKQESTSTTLVKAGLAFAGGYLGAGGKL